MHCGPFGNIAHGCNSVVATKLGLALCDIVLTEAGFGADLGAEKFLDIKCRLAGLKPEAAIIVATVNRTVPYFASSRVDSAFCQPQQTAAPIISKSPCHESANETVCEPKTTMAVTPTSDMTIPASTTELKCSRFERTPIKNANTGLSAIIKAPFPALVLARPSTNRT